MMLQNLLLNLPPQTVLNKQLSLPHSCNFHLQILISSNIKTINFASYSYVAKEEFVEML